MASLLSLSSLLGQTSIDDHEQVLKAANTVLNKSKNDVEAQHVKLVALLKLDRFDDALHVLQTGGQPLKERARLEWAYALYKAGQPAKAAEIAHQNGQDHHDRGMRHVEAQASYRNEDFERANTLYSFLAASGTTDVANEDVDLRINNSAVNAQLEWAGRGHLVKNKKPGREDLDAFETAYNAACGSIARDELGQAEILLRRAKGALIRRLCCLSLLHPPVSIQSLSSPYPATIRPPIQPLSTLYPVPPTRADQRQTSATPCKTSPTKKSAPR